MRNYVPDTIVEFYDTVSYSCEEGFFFDEDKEMTHFELTCLDSVDGAWSYLDPERKCVHPQG